MRRFIVKTALLVIIPILIIDIVMIVGRDHFSLNSHEKNILLSHNRLEALKDSTKIIIIAGSNGGFSINSQIISDAFHIPVVNTSTHAGIGVRMQFEIFKQFIRKGDIVVFCPEYGGSIQRLYGESALLRILSTHLPYEYAKFSLKQWIHIYQYMGVSFYGKLKGFGIREVDGPYSARSINRFGDISCDRPHKDSIKIDRISGDVYTDLIGYYQYIRQYTKEQGAQFVFLPPTYMRSAYEKNLPQIDSLVNCLRQNGILYMAKPNRYSFPDTLYYDTPYHMTQSGANLRSELMVEDIRRVLYEN